ncbi:hypothetical protein TrVE_jg10649 [Triparma verrucosa]|uniref:Phosphoglycerate mutase family protein n=2 Tax=Triparma TaxID=722752 RepID=A0A9W7AK56_9STRA|nr:hypothetical protein TrST_g14054 [Triparma strigata]GMI07256.1 hypothetical protein TrVE_jg10649 [Triparma verrucosa]
MSRLQILLPLLMLSLLLRRSFSSSSLPQPPRLRLILVRHGESQNNVLNLVSKQHYRENRFADPALTDLGERQAAATGEYLASPGCHPLLSGVTTVAVSPFLRTLQTSKPIVAALRGRSPSLPVELWPDIYEISGCYDGLPGSETSNPGLTGAEIAERFSYPPPASLPPSSGWYTHPGRESYAEGVSRIGAVADRLRLRAADLCAAGESETLCLVVHGDFIDVLLNQLLHMQKDPRKARFRTYNTSISAVDVFGDGMAACLFSNFHEHLKGEMCKREQLGVV